jgi:chorismate mutase/prephenate dehydratase
MKNKIEYLGPEKTNSAKAAEIISETIPGSFISPSISIQSIGKSVSSNTSEYGVVPYYNYLEGVIQQTLDVICLNSLIISKVLRLPIIHTIGGVKGKNGNHLYSISIIFEQCSDYIETKMPTVERVPVSSSAEGVRIVKENGEGMAIANKDAFLHYKLDIIDDNIGNQRHGKHNFTDFYLISREKEQEYDPKKEYLTMVAITPYINEKGLLANILQQIAYYGINNAKIHSRPAIAFVDGVNDPQMFYIEMMCHKENISFKKCIDALRYGLTPPGKDVEVVKILGSYIKL